jgi:glycosyltransferase involved in cell wall biosynthesis
VPVIASNAIGFREFIKPGTSGYVFDLDKGNDLDRLLEEALHRSPEEYNTLKEDQKQYVEANFSMKSIVERYHKMFNDVVSDGKKSA